MSKVTTVIDGRKIDLYDLIDTINACDSAEQLAEKLCVKLSAVRSRLSFLKKHGYMSAKRADGQFLIKTYITVGRGRSPMPSANELCRVLDSAE